MSRTQVLTSSPEHAGLWHPVRATLGREPSARTARRGRFAASCDEVRRTLESSGYVLLRTDDHVPTSPDRPD